MSEIKLNVLFVDDEPENTSIMRRTFRQYHNVFISNSGTEALVLLQTQKIDIIFADQRMPNMTGVEFLEKSKEFAPNAYRVLLTGYADINALVHAINRSDIDRYLTKPWTRETLLNAINQAVTRKKNLPDLSQKERLNLLIVDDEPENVNMLNRILGRSHTVFVACNGKEAIKILKENSIDIAIVDQRMPEMEGSTFLEISREIAPEMIKIMMTAYSDIEVIIEAINNAKVNKFIYKPYNPSDIKDIIQTYRKKDQQ